ncbi:hypothetical protein [Candidatus Enterococcus huntleyi]|uniref:hypothetical protein n=1 Tax=Candidatus Enterococcus huntleyi TaxID=1857217 RepID=UPI00137B021C|nr:hypothetical protein [Enterococcus sp. JM4C]
MGFSIILLILFLLSFASTVYGAMKKNKSLLLGSFIMLLALFTIILYFVCAMPETL